MQPFYTTIQLFSHLLNDKYYTYVSALAIAKSTILYAQNEPYTLPLRAPT